MPTVDLSAKLARQKKPGEKEIILFDRAVPGFGLRIHPSGRKIYIVQARIEGRTRRMTIGKHGEMDFRSARRRAREFLARIRAGENPAEDARQAAGMPTFKAFAEEYLRRCDPCWKPSGRKTVRIYLKARILPAFGRMRLDEIGPEDVARWFDEASREKPGAANQAFEILRATMNRAEEWGWLGRDANPCLNIRKNPRRKIARFLGTQELERLGGALGRSRTPVAERRSRDPAPGADRMPMRRDPQSPMARYRRRVDQPGRKQDRTADRAGGRSRCGAH